MKDNNLSSFTIINYLAILSMFIFSGAGTFMNAAIQTMIEAWPNVAPATIRMVVTLPPLVSLPVMLLIGGIVGKKVSYRFCAIFGTLLIAVGGVGPYFLYSSWGIVLFFRTLLGIGAGFLGMRNPVIVKSMPEDKQAAYIGYGAALMNVGSAVASPIIGYLARTSWRHPFLFDALAFIPAIFMLLFLKEPPKDDTAAQAEEVEKKEAAPAVKEAIPWRIWYYIIMMCVLTAALYPLLSGMSTYVIDRQLGDSVLAGTVLTAYTGFGALLNLFLGKIQELLGKWTLTVASACGAIGTLIVLFTPNVPLLFLGTVLAGGGFGLSMAMYQVYNGRVAPPSVMAFTSTVIIAMLQLGVFLSSYFIVGAHAIFHLSSDIASAFLLCAIIYGANAVFTVIAKVAPKEDYLKKTN